MSTEDQVNKIKIKLEKNRKYRVVIYNIQLCLWLIIILFPVFLLSEIGWLTIGNEYNLELWIINIIVGIILIFIIVFTFFKHYKRKKYLLDHGKRLETNLNKEEIMTFMPGGKALSMGVYSLVSYYVNENKTYRFCCKVKDDQVDLYHIFTKICEEGELPKLTVLVDVNDFSRYEPLGYKFLLDMLEINTELVQKTIRDIYASEWNYTC